jgi:hypothetical protein
LPPSHKGSNFVILSQCLGAFVAKRKKVLPQKAQNSQLRN